MAYGFLLLVAVAIITFWLWQIKEALDKLTEAVTQVAREGDDLGEIIAKIYVTEKRERARAKPAAKGTQEEP